ncbi:hypothetical protein [Undibacterium sp. WLHG33]|uniref:hypothetical protein n=1 Tax=Undibacterium sp. WLHG33 TaxID=3412482 RepID=UPI003C2EFC8C
MDFVIKPLQGVDTLHFGMQVEEVRRVLGENFKSFKRTPNSAFPCDYFADIQVFAYYKFPGVLEALEFAEPANPLFGGKRLIGVSADEVKKILEAVDQSLEVDSAGMIAHQLGVGVYAPGWDEDTAQKVESVIVFEEGYY